jgi:hypothetical protein
MGTTSVDFIVMGIHRHRETVVDLAEKVLTMCFTPHLACANSDAAVSRLPLNSNMDPRTRARASMECKPWKAILIASRNCSRERDRAARMAEQIQIVSQGRLRLTAILREARALSQRSLSRSSTDLFSTQ